MSVPAHTEHLTLHLTIAYPDHLPREGDPHYAAFRAARKRLEAAGKLQCWIGNADCAGDIELHHSEVEFALANGIDIQRFDEAYGLHLETEEEFLDYVESEGNLLPLCRQHHIGTLGIHCMPYPVWLPQRYWRGTAPAREQ